MSKQLFSGLALSLSLLFTSAAGADDKVKPAPTKAPEKAPDKAPVKAPEKAPAKPDEKAPVKTAPKAAEIDLNTATEKELAALPGIGDAIAKKIVAGRPYAKKDQLVSKKVVTQTVYDKFKDSVIAKQADATLKTDAVKPGDGSVKPTVSAKPEKAPATTPAKPEKAPATTPAKPEKAQATTPAKTEKPASTPTTTVTPAKK